MAMRWKGGAGLVLSCIFTHCALGGLPAPQNVTLISKNFSLFLTWIPEEHPLEIVYIVMIRPYHVWLLFPNCTNPSGEGCDVTCTIESCYKDYQAKVGSNVSGHQITWSQSRSFTPFHEMELGAPQVKVVLKEESVFVHLNVKLTACKEKVLKACLLDNLSYEVEYWNTDDHKRIKQSSTEKVIEIRKDQLPCSNNCVSARSVYKSILRKSNFSEPICFNLKTDGLQTLMIFATLGSLVGMLILILSAVAKVKTSISVPSGPKTPASLNFPKNVIFTHVEPYQPVECSLLHVIHCYKGEESNEQKTAIERNVQREVIETSVLGNLDSSSETEEENEYLHYTENCWIPDGVIFDKDETLDNDFPQTSKTEPYQKASFSFTCLAAFADQSPDSHCSNHSALQAKLYADIANPSSVTSVVPNSKVFHDTVDLLKHCDKSSNGDIPLTSVKMLDCNGEEIDDELL